MSSNLSRAKRRKLRYGPGGTVRYRMADGGIRITSAEKARAYVEAGRAGWAEDGILEFEPTDHRCIAAAKSAAAAAARDQFINGDGFATLDAVSGLPCVQPVKVFIGKMPAMPPKDYPSPVLISRRTVNQERVPTLFRCQCRVCRESR